MLKLNNLASAGKRRKRIGRGGARGGTSGRGFGGQKARTGAGVGVLFEGGQMPLIRRLPKRGFSNARFKTRYVVVSLDRLNTLAEKNQTIVFDFAEPVKVLGSGKLTKNVVVHAQAFSASAREAIERAGGKALITGTEGQSNNNR